MVLPKTGKETQPANQNRRDWEWAEMTSTSKQSKTALTNRICGFIKNAPKRVSVRTFSIIVLTLIFLLNATAIVGVSDLTDHIKLEVQYDSNK